MLKKMKSTKAVALMFALWTIGIITVVVATLLLSLIARVGRQEIWLDRTRAYYLCQTGLSVALLDLAAGRVPSPLPEEGYSRSFTFQVGEKDYTITYKITRIRGGREGIGGMHIRASVPSPLNLGRTYYLETSGRRAFPIFIRGRPL